MTPRRISTSATRFSSSPPPLSPRFGSCAVVHRHGRYPSPARRFQQCKGRMAGNPRFRYAASRMAVTPMPPAVQTEIRPRPRPRSLQQLRERRDEPRAGGRERVADRDAAALHVELRCDRWSPSHGRGRASRGKTSPTPRPSASRASARRKPRGSRRSRSPGARDCASASIADTA